MIRRRTVKGAHIGLRTARRRIGAGLLCLALLSLSAVQAAEPKGRYSGPMQYTDRLIVKMRPAAAAAGRHPDLQSSLQSMSVTAGSTLRHVRSTGDGKQVLALPNKLTVSQVETIAAQLRHNPDVEYAEPDRVVQPSAVPNDTLYPLQWHYKGPDEGEVGGANLPGAWDVTTGHEDVVAAVLDTGILPHADLSGRTLGGYDFISDDRIANDGDGRDADPSDPGDWITSEENAGDDATGGFFAGCGVTDSTWHGTHVAGTLAAATDNGDGVSGVNWTSKLLPVRVLGKCGGYTSDIVAAIRWAAGLSVAGVPDNAYPAKVINLSLSGQGPCSQAEQDAIDAAIAAGSVVVVAAGNNGQDSADYHPGNCSGVITVTAGDRDGARASYSNTGADIEITAPGGDASGIYSTLDGGSKAPANDDDYAYFIGTSMATAHVTGAMWLMYSAYYALTGNMLSPVTVSGKLQDAARAFPTGTGSDCTTAACGAGLLDIAAAVSAVSTIPQADAGPNQTVVAGTQVSLDGSASSDPDGSIDSYAWVQTGGAAVSLNDADTPSPSFTAPATAGSITFKLVVTDDLGLTSSDTVTITVQGVDQVVVASDMEITLEEDGSYTGTLIASDSEGNALTYGIVTNADKGTAVVTDETTGQFTYTPSANARGGDSFTFKANNGTTDSNIATVSVTITAVNDVPLAAGSTFTTAEDNAVNGKLVASDVDGDELTFSLVESPGLGTLTFTDRHTGTFTYTPDDNANGADEFSFRVSDGVTTSNAATVSVNINAVNDSPRLERNGINGMVLLNGTSMQVDFGVDDPDIVTDGDSHVYSVTPSVLGSAGFSGGVLTYAAAIQGTELLTITVRDENGDTNSAILSVTVNPSEITDSNQDGLSDTQAEAAGLDSGAADGDSDGDGFVDIYEIGDPDNPADGDGDAVIDALEIGDSAGDPATLSFIDDGLATVTVGVEDVSSRVTTLSVEDGAVLRAHVNGRSGIPVYGEDALEVSDNDYEYPFGLYDYSVVTGRATVTVTLQLPASLSLPAEAAVRKLDNNGMWRTIDDAVIDRQAGTVTLTLADNDDFDADPDTGIIRDPVGVGIPVATSTDSNSSVNNTQGSGDSGGGGGAGGPWLLFIALLPLCGRNRKRRP